MPILKACRWSWIHDFVLLKRISALKNQNINVEVHIIFVGIVLECYCVRMAVADTHVSITSCLNGRNASYRSSMSISDNKLFYENFTYTEYFNEVNQNTQIKLNLWNLLTCRISCAIWRLMKVKTDMSNMLYLLFSFKCCSMEMRIYLNKLVYVWHNAVALSCLFFLNARVSWALFLEQLLPLNEG